MGRINGPTYPNWQRAIERAQAPQLPSRVVPEERFNQTHGFHGEFATSGESKTTVGTPSNQSGQKKNLEQGNEEQNEQAQAAALLAQAAGLEQKAANNIQQANNIQIQLDAVLSQLKQLTAPFTPQTTSGAAAGGAAAGAPSQSAAATGTATLASAGTSTAGTTGTATYADQVATLQGQASAYNTQINNLRNQAADYTGQARGLRAQANAIMRT